MSNAATAALLLLNAAAAADMDAPGPGEAQVRAMLRDRPAMVRAVQADGRTVAMTGANAVLAWVAAEFGRPCNGGRLVWDPAAPEKPDIYLADHTIPSTNQPGAIRIRAEFVDHTGIRRATTFDELWSACAFELINIRNAPAFLALHERALVSTLNRTQWIEQNSRLEHKALLELQRFYRDVWKPWCREAGHQPDPLPWLRNVPEDFDAWFRAYRRQAPHDYWGSYFDATFTPQHTATPAP